MNDALAEPIAPVAAESEEVETFEALYRRAFPRVYAYVASLGALDELRRRKRGARLETDPTDVASPTVESHAEHAFRRETVRVALATLNPRVLGVSESNAGTRLYRTMDKLRRM